MSMSGIEHFKSGKKTDTKCKKCKSAEKVYRRYGFNREKQRGEGKNRCKTCDFDGFSDIKENK